VANGAIGVHLVKRATDPTTLPRTPSSIAARRRTASDHRSRKKTQRKIDKRILKMQATNVSALVPGVLNLSPRTLAALRDPKTLQRIDSVHVPTKRLFSEVQSSIQPPSQPENFTNSSAGDACMHANYHLHSVQAVQKKLDAMDEFSLQSEETQSDQTSGAFQSPRSISGERKEPIFADMKSGATAQASPSERIVANTSDSADVALAALTTYASKLPKIWKMNGTWEFEVCSVFMLQCKFFNTT
jgi:hypothetical protein